MQRIQHSVWLAFFFFKLYIHLGFALLLTVLNKARKNPTNAAVRQAHDLVGKLTKTKIHFWER